MKWKKVAKILGKQDLPEQKAIEIILWCSDKPGYPWAAHTNGTTHFAKSPHGAIDRALMGLAKEIRAGGTQ